MPSIEIDRPVEDVFAFAENPDHEPIWRSSMSDSERTTADTMKVGATARESTSFLGRRFDTVYEIIEFETNRRVAYRSLEGPIDFEGVWTYEPRPDGTKISIHINAQAGFGGVFGRLADPLVPRIARQRAQDDLPRLKDRLEA